MSEICFVDNDILLKLVACDLFYEAISLIGLDISDIRVLWTAKKVIQRNKKIKARYSDNILNSVINIINKCQKITIKPELMTEIKLLEQENNIDPGEALLLAFTSVETSFFLMTGDKRFLQALANSPELENIYKRIQGKVICLEILIYKLIKTQDFARILAKVLPVRDCDISLKSCFGSGEKADKQTVLKNLEYYIKDLQQETRGILADFYQ